MFQVKRMVSNMLGGAIELASNDSETSHAGLAHAQQRDARIAGAAEPELGMGRPGLSGVLVFAISSASTSRAGT